jgi:hypothetical protein
MRAFAYRSHAPAYARRMAPPRARPVRDFRARGRLVLVEATIDRCVLCEGAIDRFDRNTFSVAGRCCACHQELAGE